MSENTQITAKSESTQVSAGGIFSSIEGFNLALRMAKALSSSTIVPTSYRGEANIGNCVIALEMAQRLNAAPLMVMQNLYDVNGRPAWSSQFIIAMINNSRKYRTPIQYEIGGDGDGRYCYAWAEDYEGNKVVGPTISVKMAKDEGWYGKSGSKWKTMPDVMLRYRAASFFGRLHCPDMIMGIYSRDEVIELGDEDYSFADAAQAQEEAQAEIAANANVTLIDTSAVDTSTGEIAEAQAESTPTPEPTPDF